MLPGARRLLSPLPALGRPADRRRLGLPVDRPAELRPRLLDRPGGCPPPAPVGRPRPHRRNAGPRAAGTAARGRADAVVCLRCRLRLRPAHPRASHGGGGGGGWGGPGREPRPWSWSRKLRQDRAGRPGCGHRRAVAHGHACTDAGAASATPDAAAFTGRQRELNWLDAVLGTAGLERPVVILAIEGTGGIGKSALAVHAAHRLA